MIHKESRRQFLRASALASPLLAAAQPKLPNILFVQTDDQRFDDLGCYGNPSIRTPNIDRLAQDGIRFLNHFVTTAICCCSRASILTGQHMRRHGVRDFVTPLSAAQFAETYPAILRRNGYRTAFLGKYAIGNPDKLMSLPKQEFDYWLGFPQSINFKQTVDGRVRHLTPLITEKAIEFLDSMPAGKPFCLSLNFKEPHGPFNYFDPDHPNDYTAATPAAPATYTKAAFEALPGFLRKSLNGTESGEWPDKPEERFLSDVRTCYRLVSGVDAAVGKVMDALRRLKRDENTVVIFTSDNGSMRGAHGLWGKWIPYEESIRVPLIIRDPRMPAASRGTTRDQMTLNIDIAPTILGLAGLAPASRMQGRGLAPVLKNAKQAWRDEWFYEHTYDTIPPRLPIPPSEAVRTRDWKYVRYTKQTPVFEQLFDLRKDPAERINLASSSSHRSTLAKLQSRCEALRAAAD
jgi:arylsulfatase A-like enzyme